MFEAFCQGACFPTLPYLLLIPVSIHAVFTVFTRGRYPGYFVHCTRGYEFDQF